MTELVDCLLELFMKTETIENEILNLKILT